MEIPLNKEDFCRASWMVLTIGTNFNSHYFKQTCELCFRNVATDKLAPSVGCLVLRRKSTCSERFSSGNGSTDINTEIVLVKLHLEKDREKFKKLIPQP